MPEAKLTRREAAALAAGSAIAAGLAIASTPAAAYQGNMENALGALNAALNSLRAATPNKGGHRERAMALISQAMGEVQAGIDFVAAHGGSPY